MNKVVTGLSVLASLLCLLIAFDNSALTTAGAPITQWSQDFSLIHGYGNSVIQTADGGYAIAGITLGNFLLVKTDSAGNIEWHETYSGTEAKAIIQTSDETFILAGSGILIKADAVGDVKWNKTLTISGFPFMARDLIQNDDGTLALSGYINKGSANNQDYHCCIMTTDKDGNVKWSRDLGIGMGFSIEKVKNEGYVVLLGSGFVQPDLDGAIQWNTTFSSFANSLILTSDGGYLLAGQAGLLMKIDSQGNITWSKTLGSGTFSSLYAVTQTDDGGYVAAGTITPGDGYAWVVKTDSSGAVDWSLTFEGVSQSNSFVYSIIEVNDGGYVFTGGKGVRSGWHDGEDVWLAKIEGIAPSISPSPSATSSPPANVTPSSDMSHSPSDLQQPTPSPDSQSSAFPPELIYAGASVVVAAVIVAVAVLVRRRK